MSNREIIQFLEDRSKRLDELEDEVKNHEGDYTRKDIYLLLLRLFTGNNS